MGSSRFDDIVNYGYSPNDAGIDGARIGTANGPGRRPGSRKPGRRGKNARHWTPEERRRAVQSRIAKENARYDFARRAVELRRLNKTWVEIATIMSEERGEPVSSKRVASAALKELRNTDALQDVRYQELDKLESQAARLRSRLDEMDELPVGLLDIELYTKVAESYLKYRERIAKLVGLDMPTKQQVERVGAGAIAPGEALPGVHIHMPGSIGAFEEWQRLQAKGLTELAGEVLELEAGETEEVDLGAQFNADMNKAGITLAPNADVTPRAERPMSALEALDALGE